MYYDNCISGPDGVFVDFFFSQNPHTIRNMSVYRHVSDMHYWSEQNLKANWYNLNSFKSTNFKAVQFFYFNVH
jgi:hypothetical protein